MQCQFDGGSYGSDLIVTLLQESNIDYVAFNPGATFRAIQDSLVYTDGGPQLALCLHEAVSVSVAHGYAKAAGKPMAVLLHNVVGLQNASMAIYNAWCDRAPIIMVGGTGPKSTISRRPWIDWIHTANIQANLVRDFVKWDDEPHDLSSVPESFARAVTTAISQPPGPVYLCYDVSLQEDSVSVGFSYQGIGQYSVPSPPAADAASIRRALELVRSARHPVIVAGYLGDSLASMAALGRLADVLGAAVIDTGVRLALPTDHPLNGTGVDGVLDDADVVLSLDAEDLQSHLGDRWPTGREPAGPGMGRLDTTNPAIISVSLAGLRLRGWSEDHQVLVPTVEHITATADSAVEALLAGLAAEPIDSELVGSRSSRLAERIATQRQAWRAEAEVAVASGAIPLPRVIHAVGQALQDRKFVLANGTNGRLEHRQWSMRAPRQYLGWGGGGGLGYGVGATIGSALANPPDVISVDIQADGDLLYFPSALWTAARLKLRTLFVVNNNRQYGNTVEHAMKIAALRQHDTDRRYVGSALIDPDVDIAALARSFGVWAGGPIRDPDDLEGQLTAALAALDAGTPALLDVITPGF